MLVILDSHEKPGCVITLSKKIYRPWSELTCSTDWFVAEVAFISWLALALQGLGAVPVFRAAGKLDALAALWASPAWNAAEINVDNENHMGINN